MTAAAAAPGTRTVEAAAELGLTRLRPGQREAIEAAAAGRDVLAVLPTGWGKSAIYQVAALLVPGPTVVISPLLALQRDQVARALNELEAVGAAAPDRRGRSRPGPGLEEVLARLDERAERRSRFSRSQFDMVRAYVEARTCRRAFLLGYLGEVLEAACGACDVCCQAAASPGRPETPAAEPGELGDQVVVDAAPADELAAGARVRHGAFGDGEVLGVEDDVLTVVFDDVGYKQLDRTLVADADLLEVTTPAS